MASMSHEPSKRSDALAPVTVRALLRAQASHLDADSRFAITEAVGVAVEAGELYELLDEPTGWSVVSRFRHNPQYAHPRDGVPEKLAMQVRRKLNLGDGPSYHSTRRAAATPHSRDRYRELAEEIDAVTFATPVPVGLRPKSARMACGRRSAAVTLAHELLSRALRPEEDAASSAFVPSPSALRIALTSVARRVPTPSSGVLERPRYLLASVLRSLLAGRVSEH